MVILDAVLIKIMQSVKVMSEWDSVILGLISGVTGLLIVSVVIELSNKFKKNNLGFHEIVDYYGAIVE